MNWGFSESSQVPEPAAPLNPAARGTLLSPRQLGWFSATLAGKASREDAEAAVVPKVDTPRLAGFLRAACQVRAQTRPARSPAVRAVCSGPLLAF